MKQNFFSNQVFGLALLLLFLSSYDKTNAQNNPKNDLAPYLSSAKHSIGFEENKGQWKNAQTLYRLNTPQAQVKFLKNSISFGVVKKEESEKNIVDLESNDTLSNLLLKSYAFNMNFINSNPNACIHPKSERANYSQHIIKNFKAKAHHYNELWYENLFSNIDLRFYEKKQGLLEYDFILYPGAKVQDIKFTLNGIDKIKVGKNGNLLMQMIYGELEKSAPYTYQVVNGKKVEINSKFIVDNNNNIGFKIEGAYDANLPLVIDPTVLQWSTYLGGTFGEVIRDITVDNEGYIYVTGHTRSFDFPTTAGVEQTTLNGNVDIYVTKLSPDGNNIIWSTYIGGSQFDRAYGVRVNSIGEVYVAGTVARNAGQAPGFPVTTGAEQPNPGGVITGSDRDGVVAKFNSDGTLNWATYWGGAGQDRIYDIDIDPAGNAYVTGYTDSKDFPVTPGAFQLNYSGGTIGDAFVASFSAAGAIRYSTLLGGNQPDKGYAIAVNAAGEAYITGVTGSLYDANPNNNFDLTSNAFQTTTATLTPETNKNGDAFITKFNASGTALVYSTLISSKGFDVGHDIALNAAGNAYIVGNVATPTAVTANFPTTSGSFFSQTLLNYLGVLFVLEMNNDGSNLVFSNLVMNHNLTFEPSLAIDEVGGIHITGQLQASDRNLPTTSDAFQPDFAFFTNSDAIYLHLAPSGTELVYGTYLGGTFTEVGVNTSDLNGDPLFSTGITAKNCKVYVAGTTQSADFPVTPTAYADDGVTPITGYDVSFGGVTPGASGYFDGGDGTITVFNDPISTNNTLTAFASGTSFCKNGAIDPIDGNDVNAAINLPDILRGDILNTYPGAAFVKYQWQTSTTSTGPWTNIAGATTEDFITSYNTITGSRWYRRIVSSANSYQTCNADTSNAVEVVINSNTATLANAGGPYTFCGGQIVTIGEAITPSPDGSFPPYTYSWTPTTALIGTTSGTFSDPAFIPSVQTNTTVDAVYTLEIQDSRGCSSISQAVVTVLKADAGADTTFTCGNTSIIIGPPDPVDNTPTYSWTPTSGLSCSTCSNPTVTSLPPVGTSVTYKLTVNGCNSSADSTVVFNNNGITLPSSFTNLSLCQGDSAVLGDGTLPNLSYTYQWAPGFNLRNNLQIDATVVAAYAPLPVNTFVYYLTTIDPRTGCAMITTQTVEVNKMPSAAFDVDIPWCPQNTYLGTHVTFGAPAQNGMGYTWAATVVPSAAGTGVPTTADALSYLTATNISNPVFFIPGPTMLTGGLADVAYDLIYVRTSFNLNSPSCFRTDTAKIHYAPGENCIPGGCALNSESDNNAYCGSPTTLIKPSIIYYNNVNYQWTPITGLSDSNTGLPLSGTGPHSPTVFADPLVTTDYTLTATNVLTGWSCSVVLRVYAGATSTPVVNFDDVATCQGTPVLIGQTAIAGLTYDWLPPTGLNDVTISNPTATIADDADFYVTVTDTVTTCKLKDTVHVAIGKYKAFAGVDRSFCGTSGTIVDLGAPAEPGYTYHWLQPTIGLANPDSAQTKDTIYTTTTYVLETTHAASGCTARDTVVFTSTTVPVADAGANAYVCSGGTYRIGIPPLPGASVSYQWSSPSSGAGLDPMQAVVAQPVVNPTGAGPWKYYVTVTENGATGTDPACTNIDSISLTNPGTLTVPLNPAAPCAAPGVSIGPSNTPLDASNWAYTWTPTLYLASTSYPAAKNITVYPPVPTTYHLTATAPGGCVYEFDIPVPAASFAANLGPNLNLCKGGLNPTLNLLTPPPAGSTFTWVAVSPTPNTALLSATNIQNPVFNLAAAAPGSYNYAITVNYPTGCVTTDDISIKVTSLPATPAGSDVTICQGGCIDIGAPQLANVTYLWTTVPYDADKVALISNVNAAQPTVCTNSTTTYKLVMTDNTSGCSVTDYVVVNATIPQPELTVIDTTICQNNIGNATINLANLVVSHNGTALSYWYDETADLIPVPNPNAVTSSGIYYIKSTNLSGNCFVVKPVNVTINALPDVVATATPTDCNATGYANNGKITLSGFLPADKYVYNTGTLITGTPTYASANSIPLSGIILNNLGNPSSSAGQNYIIRVFNSNNCYRDVIVNMPQVVCDVCPSLTALTSNFNLCSADTSTSIQVKIMLSKPDSIKFVYFSSIQTAPNMYSGGTILDTVATVASASDTTATLSNLALPTVLTATTFYVYAVVYPTPANVPCRPYALTEVTVLPLPLISYRDTSICAGSNVDLTLLKDNSTSGGGSITYYSTLPAVAANLLPSTSVSPTLTKKYYIQNLVGGCASLDSLTVTVNITPSATNLPDTSNICPANTINLVALQPISTSISGGTFEWHTANDPSSTLVNTPTNVGNGIYYLFERSSSGCFNNGDSVQITIAVCCPNGDCIPLKITKIR